MDLAHFLKVLYNRKFLILSVFFVAVGSTYFFVKKNSVNFKSKSLLATGITDYVDVSIEGEENRNQFEVNNRFNNFIEFVKSKPVITLLSYKLVIHDLGTKNPFLKQEKLNEAFSATELIDAKKKIQLRYDSLKVLNTSVPEDKKLNEILSATGYGVKSLSEALLIKRIVGTDYIQIEFISPNPNLSAFVVNGLCTEMIRFNDAEKIDRVESSLKYFKELVDKKKTELDKRLDTLNFYKSTNSVVNFNIQSESKLGQVSALESARNEETKKVAAYSQALAGINRRLQSGYTANSATQFSNTRILDLTTKINSLNNRIIAGVVSQSAKDSLDILRSIRQREIDKVSNGDIVDPNVNKQDLLTRKINVETELEMAQANLNSINRTLGGLNSNLTGFASKGSSLSELEISTQAASQDYVATLEKYNSSKNAALSKPTTVKQVEIGQPADDAEPTKLAMFVALAGIISLVLTCGILFLLEFFDQRVKTIVHLRQMTNIKVLGSLNQLPNSANVIGNLYENNPNVSENKDNDTFKELLRKIRFEIEQSKGKIFLFTSTTQGSGKSFFIISLAQAFSLTSKRILIVDTNFKNNTLTTTFAAKPNIEKFLKKSRLLQADNSQKVQFETRDFEESTPLIVESEVLDIISPTGIPGVDIIGCKLSNFSPSEIFAGKDFKKLLNDVSPMYDYIFMEGASLNDYSDTKELIEYVDKIITVFSAKDPIMQADKTTLNYLKSLNNKFAGGLLNNIDFENLES